MRLPTVEACTIHTNIVNIPVSPHHTIELELIKDVWSHGIGVNTEPKLEILREHRYVTWEYIKNVEGHIIKPTAANIKMAIEIIKEVEIAGYERSEENGTDFID